MTVQGPVKEQQPDGMSHRGAGGMQRLGLHVCVQPPGEGWHETSSQWYGSLTKSRAVLSFPFRGRDCGFHPNQCPPFGARSLVYPQAWDAGTWAHRPALWGAAAPRSPSWDCCTPIRPTVRSGFPAPSLHRATEDQQEIGLTTIVGNPLAWEK